MSNARDKANIPALNFSSTGIDDNATSTAITIDSSERVGIGETAPFANVHVKVSDSGVTSLNSAASGLFIESANSTGMTIGSGTTNVGRLVFTDNSNDLRGMVEYNHSNDAMRFYSGGGERMRIDSSGNVGIGTSSPTAQLNLKGANTRIEIENSTGSSNLRLQIADVGEGIISTPSAYALRFDTNNTERMRIDSSGNLLVGKTTTTFGTAGFRVESTTGNTQITRNGGKCLDINRTGTIGDMIVFYDDGTEVGFIGNNNASAGLEIVGGSAGLAFTSTLVVPVNGSGNYLDNTLDLGTASYRFDDIYATNGTIQTSDENEKQSIQSLTTAEMNVAKRLSPLIKTFKWNSAVEEKGDSARTHTGIIAQDVQQAFTDEGLDASNYALFISSTWWEKEISVDAVAEEVDENGNVITEAKDAYTYIDTKEEATDGYTEKTRLGVRYPELLSFIQAYNDQRFTELEARITALETNQP